jgi:hypothetical protein
MQPAEDQTMAMTDVLPAGVALVALALLAAMVFWTSQRQAVWQAGEVRVTEAEARVATLETSLSSLSRLQQATATALAYVGSPAAAVDRSLGLVLAAEREPTDQRLRTLNETFGEPALAVVRPEVEHLLSGGLHLGDQSAYTADVVSTEYPETDQAQVRTRERWMYDERTQDDERARCLVETSDQTYTLQRAGPEWRVVDIEVTTASRTDCPGA